MGALLCHAVRNAAARMSRGTFFKQTLVAPIRPQPLGTWEKKSPARLRPSRPAAPASAAARRNLLIRARAWRRFCPHPEVSFPKMEASTASGKAKAMRRKLAAVTASALPRETQNQNALRMVPSFEVLRIECADYAGRPIDLTPGNSRSSRRILRSCRRRSSRKGFRCGLFSRAPRSGRNFFDASHSKFSSNEPRRRLTGFGLLSRINGLMSASCLTRCQCCTCCCMCVSTGARGLLT